MSKGKALLILHGKQALNEEVRAAVMLKREQGWDLAVRLTWEAGDAQRCVDEALEAGYTQLIAGGGDGTLRDIAEAIVLHSSDASLVLLPLGTANDFARAAGVPLEPAQALDLLDVAPQVVDVGEVCGRIFLNMATGGFGSQVTANTSEDLKKVLGGAAYLFTGLSRFSELSAAYGELQGPDFHWQGDLLALGIGNGRQAGGGHVLCPEALANDGLLDISILPAPQEVVSTLKDLLAGGLGIDNMFVRARLPWVEIKVAQGLDINLDGEPLQVDTLCFTVHPKALHVHLPPDSPLLGGATAINRPG
ncbi:MULTISPECIES: lipid kinase YegS [Pseudomonas]|uniref:Probable lipid kinase YegS-like n=1 Tax=Pseudomonas brassicacearum (strain NFM421) TaxID=994484 RepID=F2KEE1_PSEBN|nr:MULTISPECIES: lipid kinase YegS [Pseudomonas]AEA67857.1 putative diacylglycerol kinase [Pseudomonas brassicacearum subsp. brassicacearum NFM421]ALQ02419.1 Transcription regulator [Pseudomonas brassicacearum]AOS38641.1 lipid kinase YegS [Pseudomonas brassicacearum]PJH90221.1 lipid kinase YegS [Pseudomonas sp. WCS365]ROM81039.1 lipid kinase YegS [Pseudomonas brassicacearum]